MTDAHGVARDQLRAFIERIERLEEEKKTIADDIKDVYGEAKSLGFDSKILRKVISIRKQDADERAEQEAILDTYLHALGMIEQPGFFDDEPRQSARVDRETRAKLRTSEAMDDTKAFSAELAAAGLISQEAHAENMALSDAVARKYGAGVVDPETGEILDEPVNAKLVETIAAGVQTEIGRAALIDAVDIMIEREEAEERRSDGGLDIVTKHTEIATASQGGTASPSPDAELSGAGANAGGEDVDGSAERANINAVASASGPDEKRASNSPEEATAGPKVLDERSGDGPESRHQSVKAQREQAEEVA
ncbi:DUF2312 domain-containing protein [Sinorhizobium meliloti]|nr:DUF2312 domain-containing protein [Sinorhizobium meliloti]